MTSADPTEERPDPADRFATMVSSLFGPVGSLLLPAALIALCLAVAAFRFLRARAGGRARPGRGAAVTAGEELHALLYPGKQVQLEQRRIELVLREDEQAGAPGHTGIDLSRGTARLPR
ncbi:DUF6191 domain-containing protein [Kitasatospora sp. LaBMicrA B282]|uniref:DUF6191 domain-containing protein n=1 Tax=Kitasatospora sp. LaBMicrA B282 TaxID=3420949 RepID=UPI003D0EC4C6